MDLPGLIGAGSTLFRTRDAPHCHLHLAHHGGTDSPLRPGKRRYRHGQRTEATGRDVPIEADTNRIATHARPGHFMHHVGLTFDLAPLDAGKPIWNVSDPVWQRAGKIGKEYGLEWARHWKRFREYAHFQYTDGLSLSEIRAGKALLHKKSQGCIGKGRVRRRVNPLLLGETFR